MDCGCNCFGIASTSRFPVKRYNLLVPDIFPKKEPEVSERVDASTERKYKKLYEYIAKNPHRGPKVPLIIMKSQQSPGILQSTLDNMTQEHCNGH